MARWAKPDFTIIYKLSWNQLSEHFLTTAESWWIFLYKILFGLLYLIWSIGQWCYRGWRPQGSEKNRKSKLFAPTSSSDLKILYNWIIKLHSSKYRNIFSQPTTNESKGKKWFRFLNNLLIFPHGQNHKKHYSFIPAESQGSFAHDMKYMRKLNAMKNIL